MAMAAGRGLGCFGFKPYTWHGWGQVRGRALSCGGCLSPTQPSRLWVQ